MAQVTVAREWKLDVERGPDWLFVRLRHVGLRSLAPAILAEEVWALMEQNMAHRLVLEMDEVDALDGELVEQLIALEGRIAAVDGKMRLSGLNRKAEEALKLWLADGDEPGTRVACFRDREEAVMGQPRPRLPR
jgi:hypothetical protein